LGRAPGRYGCRGDGQRTGEQNTSQNGLRSGASP
jgi:hypothetical protein